MARKKEDGRKWSMVNGTEGQIKIKEELKKKQAELDLLLEHLRKRAKRSGEYFGTILFLNEDGRDAEKALIAELKETEGFMELLERGGVSAYGISLAEDREAILRLIGKFNRCHNTGGQHGKHYALDLDLDEYCFLEKILDDAGITYWEHY